MQTHPDESMSVLVCRSVFTELRTAPRVYGGARHGRGNRARGQPAQTMQGPEQQTPLTLREGREMAEVNDIDDVASYLGRSHRAAAAIARSREPSGREIQYRWRDRLDAVGHCARRDPAGVCL